MILGNWKGIFVMKSSLTQPVMNIPPCVILAPRVCNVSRATLILVCSVNISLVWGSLAAILMLATSEQSGQLIGEGIPHIDLRDCRDNV